MLPFHQRSSPLSCRTFRRRLMKMMMMTLQMVVMLLSLRRALRVMAIAEAGTRGH